MGKKVRRSGRDDRGRNFGVCEDESRKESDRNDDAEAVKGVATQIGVRQLAHSAGRRCESKRYGTTDGARRDGV